MILRGRGENLFGRLLGCNICILFQRNSMQCNGGFLRGNRVGHPLGMVEMVIDMLNEDINDTKAFSK
jgi:hypothetical protein